MKSFVNFIAMMLLLPGLIALVADASLKTHYFDTRPREVDDLYSAPLTLNGQTVYVTDTENEQLNELWFYGVRGFAIGLGLWILSCGMHASHLEQHRHHEYGESD